MMTTQDPDELDVLMLEERDRLLRVLGGLDAAGWTTPSLCHRWRVRDVVAHLLMPYQLSIPRFFVGLAAARFSFDRLADRLATRNQQTPTELVEAVRASVVGTFPFPGSPPEGALSHVVIHSEDVLRPLGVPHQLEPRAARIVLDQLTGPRFGGLAPKGLREGLRWRATDVDWTSGEGEEVVGSASALIAVLAGRPAAVGELGGEGAVRVQERFDGHW